MIVREYFKSYFWVPTLISFLLYFKSIYFGTAWEDDSFVIQPVARDFNLMLEGFYSNISGSHFFPFSFFQCYLINSLFHYPFGFHLYSFFVHVFCTGLSTVVLYKIVKNKGIAVLMSVIWAVHPINVEIITRVGCSPAHLPAALFTWLGLYFTMKAVEVKRKSFYLVSFFFNLISITTYEQYILFPLVSLLIIYFFSLKKDKFDYLKIGGFSIILFYIVYVLWRYFASGSKFFYSGSYFITWTDIGALKDILFRAFWLSPQLIVHYLKMFFFPDYLAETKADWFFLGDSLFSFYSLFCQFLTFLILVSAFFFRKKNPLFSIGVAWFFLSMLPVIQIIPLFNIIDEHYCYFSIFGILIATFSLLPKMSNSKSFKSLLILFLPIISLLCWRTVIYIPSGKDELTQAIFRAKESPDFIRPIYIAKALKLSYLENRTSELPPFLNEVDATKELLKWLNKNLEVKLGLWYKFGPIQMPYNYDLYPGICSFLYKVGAYKELNILINQAIEIKNNWYGFYKFSQYFYETKQYNNSWLARVKSYDLNPKYKYLFDLTFIDIAINAHKTVEAEDLLKKVIKAQNDDPYMHLILGLLYSKLDKKNFALDSFKEVLQSPNSLNFNDLACYKEAIKYLLAIKEYELAKEITEALKSIDPIKIEL